MFPAPSTAGDCKHRPRNLLDLPALPVLSIRSSPYQLLFWSAQVTSHEMRCILRPSERCGAGKCDVFETNVAEFGVCSLCSSTFTAMHFPWCLPGWFQKASEMEPRGKNKQQSRREEQKSGAMRMSCKIPIQTSQIYLRTPCLRLGHCSVPSSTVNQSVRNVPTWHSMSRFRGRLGENSDLDVSTKSGLGMPPLESGDAASSALLNPGLISRIPLKERRWRHTVRRGQSTP